MLVFPTVSVPLLVKLPVVVKLAPPLMVKLDPDVLVVRRVRAFVPLWFSSPPLPVRVIFAELVVIPLALLAFRIPV